MRISGGTCGGYHRTGSAVHPGAAPATLAGLEVINSGWRENSGWKPAGWPIVRFLPF